MRKYTNNVKNYFKIKFKKNIEYKQIIVKK
jgi:hypothetical protein